MKVIGLTGGTGSGKSAVSRFLREAGAIIIDADNIAHDIILKGKPAYEEIIAYYGKDILDEVGEIVRRRLGEIVFHNPEKLAFLNRCTHKYIAEETKRQIAKAKEENKAKAIVIDAPLLLEAKLEVLCDALWVVYADEDTRAKRVMERDGITYEMAIARISNQKTWEEYSQDAHVIIDNSNGLEELEIQMKQLVKEL